MHDKIRNYVYSLLTAAPDCPIKKEIQEEMIANLFEKYNDLVASGMAPEEAYKEVISGIGDMSELIDVIKESAGESTGSARHTYTESSAGRESDFSDFTQKISDFTNKLSRELEPMIRNITKEAVSASKRVRNESHGRFGGHIFNNYQQDYEVDPAGVQDIVVNFRSGDVEFGYSDDNMIRITERSNVELSQEQKLSIEKRGESLHLEQGKTMAGTMFFGFGRIHTSVEIRLPRRQWREFNITSISGDKNLGKGFILDNLRTKSASGDLKYSDIIVSGTGHIESGSGEINISGSVHDLYVKSGSGDLTMLPMNCSTLTIEKISGDSEITGNFASINVKSTSGDSTFKNVKTASLTANHISGDFNFYGEAGKVNIKTTSGDVKIENAVLPLSADLYSVSGDIKMSIPENDGFNVKYKKISGSIKSDFEIMTSLNNRNGTGIYKNGGPEFNLETTSGDIKILKK